METNEQLQKRCETYLRIIEELLSKEGGTVKVTGPVPEEFKEVADSLNIKLEDEFLEPSYTLGIDPFREEFNKKQNEALKTVENEEPEESQLFAPKYSAGKSYVEFVVMKGKEELFQFDLKNTDEDYLKIMEKLQEYNCQVLTVDDSRFIEWMKEHHYQGFLATCPEKLRIPGLNREYGISQVPLYIKQYLGDRPAVSLALSLQ